MISYGRVPYGVIEIEGHPTYSICYFKRQDRWRIFIGYSNSPPFDEREKVWVRGEEAVREYFAGVRGVLSK